MESKRPRLDAASSEQEPCSEKHLAEISTLIPDWREVSPFLGLTEAEEVAILESTHSVPARKMAMLRKWKQKRGPKATYKRLCRAFSKCEKTDIVEMVKQLLTESSGSSDEEGLSSFNSLSSHPHPLSSYASYLRELYICMSQSHTSQHWTNLPPCEFIQLAMIKNENIRRGGPEEEMIRLAQQGKIETIMSHKKSIMLCDLFPRHQPPSGSVCLVEGAPGAGKSTLALHICHQWAQDASWLARFEIVVLVYLRDEAVQNATTLADILPARNLEMSQEFASQLQATDGKNVLFIFDGWDEFPSDLMNDSFVSKLIRQPHKLSLHQSTVLITTRPVSSGNLLHIADRRVEILGFTQHQIREYIEKALDGNSTSIQKLIQHLEEHPVIEGYCYIPLHAAILVHLFLTRKGALPTTHHELFCDLVLCCIVREQETHHLGASLPELFELSSLDDLPDDLKSKLNNVSMLAYNGAIQDKVVFFLSDLHESRLPADFPSLGLLQAVGSLTKCSKSFSYNFLHLSAQELLAAYHISQMPSNEHIEVFTELCYNPRFQPILFYYCGFTKLDNLEIQKFISSFQEENPRLNVCLPFLHCFFEAQQPQLCQLVDPRILTDTIESFSINPVDYLVIGYFITSLLSISTANEPAIHVSFECIDDHCLNLLLSELSKYENEGISNSAVALSRKLVLDFDDAHITGQGVKYLSSHLRQSPAISKLVLRSGVIQEPDEDRLLHIAETLQTNTSLTKLCLHEIGLQFTEQSGSALTKLLKVNKSLKKLDLSDNSISDSGACCIFEGLQQNTTLSKLNLSNTGIIVPDTARSLTESLQVNKSLRHLDISQSSLLNYGARLIFESLQHNDTLLSLNVSDVGMSANDPDTVKSLTKMIRVNKSLTHLDISENGLELCSKIFESLQHNTTLVSLNLSDTGISVTDPDTVKSLTKMFQLNKSLESLDFSLNRFSDFGACCIFEGLQHNTTLVELNLEGNNVTGTDPDTLQSLTKMFQVNKSLSRLDLSSRQGIRIPANQMVSLIFQELENNDTGLLHLILRGRVITDDDAACIARALSSNICLQTLDIASCSLTDDNIVLIIQSTTRLKELSLPSALNLEHVLLNQFPPVNLRFVKLDELGIERVQCSVFHGI